MSESNSSYDFTGSDISMTNGPVSGNDGSAGEMEVISGEQERQRVMGSQPGEVGVQLGEDFVQQASERELEEEEPMVAHANAEARVVRDGFVDGEPASIEEEDRFFDTTWDFARPRRPGETFARFLERIQTVAGHVGGADGPRETKDERENAMQRCLHQMDARQEVESRDDDDLDDEPYRWSPEMVGEETDIQQTGWDVSRIGRDVESAHVMASAWSAQRREAWSADPEGQKFGTPEQEGETVPTLAYSLEDLFGDEQGAVIAMAQLLAEEWDAEWSRAAWPEEPSTEFLADMLATKLNIERYLKPSSHSDVKTLAEELHAECEANADESWDVRHVPELPASAPAFCRLDDDEREAAKARAEQLADRWEPEWSDGSQFDAEPDVLDLAYPIARKMEAGASARDAGYEMYQEGEERAASHIIGGIPSWKTNQKYSVRVDLTSVKVVAVFEEPAHPRQAQAFIVQDEHGREAKVGVWKGHDYPNPTDWRKCQVGISPESCDYVAQGDIVTLENFTVRSWNGQPVLESSRRNGRESDLTVVERADEREVHTGYPDVEGSEEQSHTPCRMPTTGETHHAGTPVRSQDFVEEHGFYACTSWEYPRESCPQWFIDEHEGAVADEQSEEFSVESVERHIENGECPVPGCDFETDTWGSLRGHIGGKVNAEAEGGRHHRVQVTLEAAGLVDE
jgi:hypothetical protein